MRIVYYGSLILFLCFIASVNAETSEPRSEAESKHYKKLAHQIIDEAWNQGKLAILTKVYKADLAEITKRNISDWRQGWSNLHITVTEQLEQDGKVISLWTFNGTHDGLWRGQEPTHSKVTFSGTTMQQFSDGKIVKEWDSRADLYFEPEMGMVIGKMQAMEPVRSLQPLAKIPEHHEKVLPEREFIRFMHDLQRRHFQSAKLDYIDAEVPNYHFTVAQMLEVLEKGQISFSADRRHVFQIFYPRLVDHENINAALKDKKYFSRTEKRKLEAWINEYQRRRNLY